jgi:hypothetical protein
VSRQQELAEDVHKLSSFLAVLVAEAAHLGLPVPASMHFCLCELAAWERKLLTMETEAART